jgi:hypothetical protein
MAGRRGDIGYRGDFPGVRTIRAPRIQLSGFGLRGIPLLGTSVNKGKGDLVDAMSAALLTVSARDPRGFFELCGYRTSLHSL